jgi:hypothetical protein
MLDALVAGETDPQRLAKLAKGSLIPKVKPLAEALRGGFASHHFFLLGQMLTQLDQLAAMVAQCDARILEVSKPFEANIQRLQDRRCGTTLGGGSGVRDWRGHVALLDLLGNEERGPSSGSLRPDVTSRRARRGL